MQPVAVGIEVVLGEIFIPFDAVGLAEVFSFRPGFGLDADELDVTSVRCTLDKLMAEFV